MIYFNDMVMKKFKEFQFAWWLVIAFIVTLLLVTTPFKIQGDSLNRLLVVSIVFITIAILFYGLKTEIDDHKIRLSFGIGLIRKTIRLDKIKTVTEVRNNWIYGWGVRFIPNGMLYNISGLKAVELTFYDSGRIIRIGTSDTKLLKNEIEKYITQ